MEIKDIRTIKQLISYLRKNISKDARNTQGTWREEAEWFLACVSARGWSENRTKDNAYFALEGVTALKGNDDEAARIIGTFFEDADYAATLAPEEISEGYSAEDAMAEAVEMFEEAIDWHYGR